MNRYSYILIVFFLSFIGCSKEDPENNELPVDQASSNAVDYFYVENTKGAMPLGGTIIAQEKNGSLIESIVKLVDNDVDTYYSVKRSSMWIIWKSDAPFKLDFYSLTSAKLYPENDPKTWTLYGSNDSINWIVLDNQKNILFTDRRESKVFGAANSNEFCYFKLDILDNNGGERIQIADWGLNNSDIYSIDDLMSSATGFTSSSITPMGKHYENRPQADETDKAWLMDSDNEPSVPVGLLGKLTWQYYKVILFPFGKPLPADVNQHSIGDCGAVAALASLAYVYPEYVKSLIKKTDEDTYIVSMFDPNGNPVEVALSSFFLGAEDGVLSAVTGKNDVACWSTLLEKAIMKYNEIYKVDPNIEGIGSEHVLPLFTGKGDSFAFAPGRLNSTDLKRAVVNSLRQGKLIIGGFNQGDRLVDDTKTVTAHAYTLMHPSASGALFVMRNPWGGNPDQSSSKDGVVNIPNEASITDLIDLRVVEPGNAGSNGIFEPYTPPAFRAAYEMRVDPRLMR